VPYLIPETDTEWRAIAAIASVYYFSRVHEILMTPRKFDSLSLIYRLMHVQLAFHHVDTFRDKPLAKSRAALLKHVPKLLAASLGLVVSRYVGSTQGPPLLLHALAGAIHIFSALQMFGSVLSVLYLAVARIEVPELMQNPQNAQTLQDFWAKRWNSVVQQSLYFYIYSPLQRSGVNKSICVISTFSFSGLLHAYAMWAAGSDLLSCCSVAGYFVVQAILLLVEGFLLLMLPTNCTSSLTGSILLKLWTFSCILLPLPLATEPIFDMLSQ